MVWVDQLAAEQPLLGPAVCYALSSVHYSTNHAPHPSSQAKLGKTPIIAEQEKIL